MIPVREMAISRAGWDIRTSLEIVWVRGENTLINIEMSWGSGMMHGDSTIDE